MGSLEFVTENGLIFQDKFPPFKSFVPSYLGGKLTDRMVSDST